MRKLDFNDWFCIIIDTIVYTFISSFSFVVGFEVGRVVGL